MPDARVVDGGCFAPWTDELGRALTRLADPVEVERDLARLVVLRAPDEAPRALARLAEAGLATRGHAALGDAVEEVFVAFADLERAARVLHTDLIESPEDHASDRAASA